MSIREYQFVTGIETSTSPIPSTPSDDADAITKGFADDTYAQFTSWGTKAADITAVKAIAAADRSNGQVVMAITTGALYKFNSGSSATGDDDTILEPSAGTGRWEKVSAGTGGSSGDAIVQQLDVYDSGITAGAVISNRDAVCLQLHKGTGTNVYRAFPADMDNGAKRNFVGFAKAAGTVTPQITSYTISAAYVSGNIVPITINERSYSTTYASSSDATLQALATLIATDQDVASATVTVVGGNQTGTDDRIIVITSVGGLSLNITGTTVTSGASQPTVTIPNSQTASGSTMDIHMFGALTGFSGLVAGNKYYLSTTAGAITSSPVGYATYVGQAITTTILFCNPNAFNIDFGTQDILIQSHGTTTLADATAVLTSYHFNYTSWSSGTSDGTALNRGNSNGSGTFNGAHIVMGGYNTSGTAQDRLVSYNKTSWSTLTAQGTARALHQGIKYNGYFYVSKGDKGGTSSACDKFNGSTWTTTTAWTDSRLCPANFTVNSLLNSAGGNVSTTHETKNTSDTNSTATSHPADNGYITASGNAPSSYGLITDSNAMTKAYMWNGTSWTSAITDTLDHKSSSFGGGISYSNTKNLAYLVGGVTNSTNLPVALVRNYNGSTITADTAMGVVRSSGVVSCI